MIDVGENLKRRLYRVLEVEGMTLKDWFIQTAEEHIAQFDQPRLLPKEHPASKNEQEP